MTFISHDTKISLVYEEKNAFMHEYYHSTTVKYSESAPKVGPTNMAAAAYFRLQKFNADALSSLLYRSVGTPETDFCIYCASAVDILLSSL